MTDTPTARVEIHYPDRVITLGGIKSTSLVRETEQIEVTLGGSMGGPPPDMFRRFMPGPVTVKFEASADTIEEVPVHVEATDTASETVTVLTTDEIQAVLQALPYCCLAWAEGVLITRPPYAEALDSAWEKLANAIGWDL